MKNRAEIMARRFFYQKEIKQKRTANKIFISIGFACHHCGEPLFYYLGNLELCKKTRLIRQYAIDPLTMDIPKKDDNCHKCKKCLKITKYKILKIYKFIGRKEKIKTGN